VLDVRAGDERTLAGAGEHDDAYARVGRSLFEPAAQGLRVLHVERVQRVRPVHGDDRDTVVALEVNAHRHASCAVGDSALFRTREPVPRRRAACLPGRRRRGGEPES
jgi:hypothetical protein